MEEWLAELRAACKRKKNWVLYAASLLLGPAFKLLEHWFYSTILDWLRDSGAPAFIKNAVLWCIAHPLLWGFYLVPITFCGILIHAYFSSRHEPQHAEAPTDSPSSAVSTINMKQEANPHIEVNPQFYIHPSSEGPKAREPIQATKTRKQISKPPSHNIVFLGGHRYDPKKHGLLDGPRESDMMRIALAEFRNRHIVGSTVGHVYNVRAGITYSDDNGTEVLYISPGGWLKQDEDTIKLESGAESEFVVLAIYNYIEKRWEANKKVRTRHYMGDFFLDEPRPLPFSTITAEIALLEKDGSALQGGTVTLELKKDGNFEIR